MRPVAECWAQDPAVLQEEIELRRKMIPDMLGWLYPSILEGEIQQLLEILTRREQEIAAETERPL